MAPMKRLRTPRMLPALSRSSILRRRLVLLLCVSAFGALLPACSKRGTAALPPGTTALALGDSVTAGYGLGPQAAWPALLAAGSGWEIVNAGVNGETTEGGLARLPALLEQHAPRLVFVELGGNDMLRRVPEAETIANLDAILRAVSAAGARPVLIAAPQPSVLAAVLSNLSPAPFYEQLAHEHGAVLVEDAMAEVLSRPDSRLDPLHPNQAGHARLADGVAAALRRAGLLR
jgi:acyl-CoA hydrolase